MLMISSFLTFFSSIFAFVRRFSSRQKPHPQWQKTWPTPMIPFDAAAKDTSPTFRILYKDSLGNTWFRLSACRNTAEEIAEDVVFCNCECGRSCKVVQIERLADNCWEVPLKSMPKEISIHKTDPDAFEKQFILLRWDGIRNYTLHNQPEHIVFTYNQPLKHQKSAA